MSEEEEEVDRKKQFEVHEGIIFAIELTDSLLFINPDNGKSNLQIILEALQESMAHSIITLPNTGYGCYLFNGENTSNGCPSGIERLFALKDLNAKDMKVIHDILEQNVKSDNDERPYVPLTERFKPLVGKNEAVDNPLYDLLNTLRDDFDEKKEFQKQYNNRKIFLFTDNDTPIDPRNADGKRLIRKVREDLEDDLINIIPFFLKNFQEQFNDELYSELMLLTNSNDDEWNEDALLFDGPSTKPIEVDSIMERIIRRKEIKRMLFQCPFIFSDDLVVGLKGLANYTHETPKAAKQVYETENFRKNIYKRTRYVNEKTGEEFEKTKRVFTIGNGAENAVKLDAYQESLIHRYEKDYDVYLRLIGFKDEEYGLKTHYNISTTASFVVPEETSYDGSTRTMSALYSSLRKKNKVAIVFGKIRRAGTPNFYALQAMQKRPFLTSKAYFPEAFLLVKLPYYDDIRQCPVGYDFDQSPPETVKVKSKMILRELKKMFDEYLPKNFKNPGLQQHYRVLHDFLLQVEQDPNVSEEEIKLKNDDTLKSVNAVRQVVNTSQFGGGKGLYGHLKDWNDLYESSK